VRFSELPRGSASAASQQHVAPAGVRQALGAIPSRRSHAAAERER